MTKINTVDFKKGDKLLPVHINHPSYNVHKGSIFICPNDVESGPGSLSPILHFPEGPGLTYARRFIKLDKNTYKVGDRVVGVAKGDTPGGREGIVQRLHLMGGPSFLVDFGKGFAGHTRSERTGDLNCWWVDAEDLLPAEFFPERITTPYNDGKAAKVASEVVTAARFKVGDKVRLLRAGEFEGIPYTRVISGVVLELGKVTYNLRVLWQETVHGSKEWWIDPKHVELVADTPDGAAEDAGEFVLMLWEGGSYKLATTTKVLKSYKQAKRVARDITEKHGGQFVIFKAVAKSEAKAITRYESDLVELA